MQGLDSRNVLWALEIWMESSAGCQVSKPRMGGSRSGYRAESSAGLAPHSLLSCMSAPRPQAADQKH